MLANNPVQAIAASHTISAAEAAASAASSRCRIWPARCRAAGDSECPTMEPMLYAGNSIAAAQVRPWWAAMKGSTTAPLLSCIPAVWIVPWESSRQNGFVWVEASGANGTRMAGHDTGL
ncbi:hypothetical protein BRW65_21090 [Mycobacterium paraffinicum]|uniref:Uncharacterized protein n=1 Tax=Mycobacterium paraffinicum TaxID=53378 RepID=A0A1Q4HQ05_9MYCO|nr:hypothetical protein BRW65_21090 [Mycobacterium paraffinicum]